MGENSLEGKEDLLLLVLRARKVPEF